MYMMRIHNDLLSSHVMLQKFGPDLMVTDIILAGDYAQADKLGVPKAVIFASQIPPILNYAMGAGSHRFATVTQYNTGLPRIMVSCWFLP